MTGHTERAVTEAQVRELREKLDHPIIDADGHLLENLPLLWATVDRLFGLDTVSRVVTALRERPMLTLGDATTGTPRGAWWGIPNDTDDVATTSIPDRLAARLNALGIDYAVLYPTVGLGFPTVPDADVRQPLCRALNVMNAELTAPHQALMTVAAVIPMHDPDEALAELRYAVDELGSKVVVITPGAARPVPSHPEAFPAAHRVDRFGLDSTYDYDPVWEFISAHRLALAVHGGAGYVYLPPPQQSPTNFVANHLLAHASLLNESAKSLILGGVYDRFPELQVAYLEGGAGWAVDLMHAMVEHHEKRGPDGLELLDPKALDIAALTEAFRAAGMPAADLSDDVVGATPVGTLDEWATSGLASGDEIVALFRDRMFVGCEGDDRGVRRAFDAVGNIHGVQLSAMFSSDIGHWDVPRLAGVVPHTRELVDSGAITDDDYRQFVFGNAVRFFAGADPDFFAGTAVADAASAELTGATT